jgi:hypothetical protein
MDEALTAKTRAGLDAIQRRALIGALRRDVTIGEIKTTAAVGSTGGHFQLIASVRAQVSQMQPSDFKRLLSESTRTWLDSQTAEAQRAFAQEASRFLKQGDAAIAQIQVEVKSRTESIETDAGRLFQLVGGLRTDVDKMTGVIKSVDTSITQPLQKSLDQVENEWSKTYDTLRRVTGADAVANAQATANQVFGQLSSLSSVLDQGFRDRASFERTSTALLSSSVLPDQARVALTSLQTFNNASAGFSGKADAVLSLASVIAPNEIQAVKGVLRDIGPVLSAAGPLLALSGFGAPFAMGLSAFGGGGSSGPDPAVMAELLKINAKLDAIINQLNRIEERMIKQHRETMEALEALHFDVRRLLSIEQRQAFEQLLNSCSRSVDIKNAGTAKEEYRKCVQNIWDQLTPTGVPGRLAMYSNLAPVDGKSSLEEWRRLTAAHEVVFRDTSAWCGTLLQGRASVDELLTGAAKYTPSEMARGLCADVADHSKLLEPTLLSQMVTHDLAVSRIFAAPWARDERDRSLTRWNYELRLLNISLGQQAAFSGFADIAEMGGFLFRKRDIKGFEGDEKRQLLLASLKNYSALAENAMRGELRKRYGRSAGAEASYAFGFYSSDAMFLNVASGLASATAGSFLRKGETHCYESSLMGSDRCIALPSPFEPQDNAPRITSPFQLLVEQRDELLRTIEMAQLQGRLAEGDRERMIEMVTLKNLQRERLDAAAARKTAYLRQSEMLSTPTRD